MEKYARQIIIPEIGKAGQERIRCSRVLVVGAGGLGSPAAQYLAAAGIGTLGIADFDVIDITNLQRQILYKESSVGQSKVHSAAEAIRGLNPDVDVIPLECRITEQNAEEVISRFDIVLGCLDTIHSRYVLNSACANLGKPNIFGAVSGFEGQASVFSLNDGPCYHCFFAEPPTTGPSYAEMSILGSVAGIIGSIQANETIKIITGAGMSLSGRLLLFDGLAMRFREIAVKKDPDCPVCGRH